MTPPTSDTSMSNMGEDTVDKARAWDAANASWQKGYEAGVKAERTRAAATARKWGKTAESIGQVVEAAIAEDIASCIEEGK